MDLDNEWNDGGGDRLSNLLQLERPTACRLPCLVRFRSFSSTGDSDTLRDAALGGKDANFLCVHKRRRLDDVPCCESEAVVQPLLSVLHDPAALARRRWETLRWFDIPRTANEIVARFALDRRLGATPSLAVTHRAIARLKELRCTELIADLAEDLVMDTPAISVWTLLKIVDGLKGEPQRAASILFTMNCLIANGTVPTGVWVSLCCELDKLVRQLPPPLEFSLVELFGKVFQRIRDDGPVSGSIVIYYGQVLLKSRTPIRGVVEFVQLELLSGRNLPPADAASEVRLAAFLSDLIEVICAVPETAADEREEGVPLSVEEKLLHCSDLIKHAYANRLRLTQSAFDVFLLFCDEAQDYHRLCILFFAVCVLSSPTLLSATRFVEVLCDINELLDYIKGVLHQPVSLFILYVIFRHGRQSLFVTEGFKRSNVEALERHFCSCIARLCALDGDASICMDVFAALVEFGSTAGAHAFICALSYAMPLLQQSFAGGCAIKTNIVALEFFNVETLYYALHPTSITFNDFSAFIQKRQSALLFPPRDGSCVTPERALSKFFASPHVYGTIIDTNAVCSLAESASLAEAFVKMMEGYAAKAGAFAFVHFDVCASNQLTEEARQLLVTWLGQYSWLVLFPLSLAAQLAIGGGGGGVTTASTITQTPQSQIKKTQRSCVSLFHAVRRIGHARVIFVTALSDVVEEVKADGVHPAITLTELRERLGVRQ